MALTFISTSCLAVQCENSKPDNSDDFNLLLTSSGLQSNSRILSGAPLTLKARTSWLHGDMISQSSLNAQLYLDGSLQGGYTTPIGSTSPSYAQTYVSLSTGMHTAEARSSTDVNCSTQGTFIVQSAPVANANGNYTAIIGSTNPNSTATVYVNGTSSTDTINSLKLNEPTITWNINGTSFSGDSASINLPHGIYTAKFTVNDGTFKNSDTATITVIDQLNVSWIISEAVCVSNRGRNIMDWEENSYASYYEFQHKPYSGSWSSVGSVTNTNYIQDAASPNRELEKFRVRACTSAKCGEWKTESYFTPNCSNFIPY